ncbi:hypothetical protein XELAEV_18006462mg [Xenopus laevis]|uniref:Uncharacterized protein n=1 Tax=Xenopus laevis TaxID=8355 RepID=A0A974I481_XENLA|nr:hypothetical protein XELAEV_18006462mg [Xenopus laevis]
MIRTQAVRSPALAEPNRTMTIKQTLLGGLVKFFPYVCFLSHKLQGLVVRTASAFGSFFQHVDPAFLSKHIVSLLHICPFLCVFVCQGASLCTFAAECRFSSWCFWIYLDLYLFNVGMWLRLNMCELYFICIIFSRICFCHLEIRTLSACLLPSSCNIRLLTL